MVSIVETLGSDEYKINLLEAFKHFCSDRSWRVRYMVADNYTKVNIIYYYFFFKKYYFKLFKKY